MVNILGFVAILGLSTLVTSTGEHCTDNRPVSGHGCAPGKPYLQKQARGHVFLTLKLTMRGEGMRDRREEMRILRVVGEGYPEGASARLICVAIYQVISEHCRTKQEH